MTPDYDAADLTVDPRSDELYEWALAEAARAGTPIEAIEVLAFGLGIGDRFEEIRP